MAITVNGAPSSFPSTALSADLAATITDESGTGALIFATSPTFTTPDVVYANASNTLAKLAIGTSGQTLSVSAGGIVEWTTPSAGTTANDQAFAFAVQVFA
jgi:hypothetical protein